MRKGSARRFANFTTPIIAQTNPTTIPRRCLALIEAPRSRNRLTLLPTLHDRRLRRPAAVERRRASVATSTATCTWSSNYARWKVPHCASALPAFAARGAQSGVQAGAGVGSRYAPIHIHIAEQIGGVHCLALRNARPVEWLRPCAGGRQWCLDHAPHDSRRNAAPSPVGRCRPMSNDEPISVTVFSR
jgi:hypothetical protein